MSDRMPEYMSNRMSDCYVRIYATAGITRSKIIVFIRVYAWVIKCPH